jgi:hypothetical protein
VHSHLERDAEGESVAVVDDQGHRGDQIEAGTGRITFTGRTKARPPRPVTPLEVRADGWLVGAKAV